MRLGREIIETGTNALCWMRQRQVLNTLKLPTPLRVNLGCGLEVAPGWVNIDASFNSLIANCPSWFQRHAYRISGAKAYYSETDYLKTLNSSHFYQHDLKYGIPIQDASVDVIFSCHFLEHLRLPIARKLLRESYRVLKVGGIVRIVVPDLDYAVSLLNSGERRRSLESYFFVDHDECDFSRHKYMYDYVLLADELAKAGFGQIEKKTFREGVCPDLDILDNRPEESLFVEAKRLS